MKGKKVKKEKLSWKKMFHLYRQIKIPWVMLILSGLMLIAFQEVSVLVVPYKTKIMTGAITEHGFLAGFVAMSLLNTLIEAIQGGVNELAGAMTARNARATIWRKMIHLPMSFYKKDDTQQLVSRVTQDTSGLYGALAVIVQIIAIIFGIAEAFRRMYRTYKMLALIMLTGIPVIILCSILLGKMEYRIVNIRNDAMSKMTNFFAERLPSVLHIKTCNMEDEEYQKGVKANDDRYRAEKKAEGIFIFTGPIGSLAQYVNEIILLLVASALVRSGSMKMFQLVNLYNYYILFMANSYMLIAIWQSIKSSHGASAVIGEIADEKEEDLFNGEVMGEDLQDIRFENVSYSYDGQTPVLNSVSFTIPKGKRTVIVGENGSGKSTILKLLEQFDRIDGGSIFVGERNLYEIQLASFREKVGYLFQGNQIVRGTIEENVAYGLEREYTHEEFVNALQLANAVDFVLDKEEGIDTEVSHFDPKCSGGEIQRIAVARMILKRPDYLIMDEATSGIDVVSAKSVMEGVSSIMKNKTILMVSHDRETIKNADHIVVLKDGCIEASGAYEEVFAKSSLFRRFLEDASLQA